MFNKKKTGLFFTVLFSCLIGIYSIETYGRDSNGVEVTDFQTGILYGIHIDHFTSFNPTSSTYIYNEAGGTLTVDGSVSTQGISGGRTLIISVPTLGSTSLDFRLEGKVGTVMTTWGLLSTLTIDATTTIDTVIDIPKYITAYRLGVKVNTNGTDVINASTSMESHR